MTIPVVIAGSGVSKAHAVQQSVDLTDVAPTLFTLLGIDVPKHWLGTPIDEVFSNTKEEAKG